MGADVSGSKSAKSEPNVVPLCDILLVLLIIFMVVTPMIKGGTNVSLPETKYTDKQPEPGQKYTLSIKKDGTVQIEAGGGFKQNLVVTDLEKLSEIITQNMEENNKTENKVLLRIDEEVAYGKIVDVMKQLRNARFEIVGLITKQRTGS